MYGENLWQDGNGGRRIRLEMTADEARCLCQVISPGIPQLPPDALATLKRGLQYLLDEQPTYRIEEDR